MKKSISNSVVCIGDFKGPDIEDGTFHHLNVNLDDLHKKTSQKCPCGSIGSDEDVVSDDSNEDNENGSGNND